MQSQIDLEGDIDQASWFLYMDVGQQHLVKTALFLLEDAENMLHTEPFPDYADYSYCIFPAAKAFEGLLKKYLRDEQLITQDTFNDRRFRIGRALNPDVRESHRDERWLYDDVSQFCGEGLANQIWQAWLECRNHVFHYFADEIKPVSLEEARWKVVQILECIDAVTSCYYRNQAPQEAQHGSS